MRLEEGVEVRDVLRRHIGALRVQSREGDRDVGVGEAVEAGEQFAADDGVDVVAAAPEAPFPTEVGGAVDGVGGLTVHVWDVSGSCLFNCVLFCKGEYSRPGLVGKPGVGGPTGSDV